LFTFQFWATVVYVKASINRINNKTHIYDYICATSSSQIHALRPLTVFEKVQHVRLYHKT